MAEGVLVLDVGGTKTLAALVRGAEVLAEARVPTDATASPDIWIDAAGREAAAWAGRFDRVAAAVTGIVADGCWSALNPGTLAIPDGFPLEERLRMRFGVPAVALNDAQAAAWGEYRHGAGQGADMAFVTVSTGVGGGIVLGGRLLRGRGGLAGHFGIAYPLPEDGAFAHVEDGIAGRWVAAEAAREGHLLDARGVFEAPGRGEAWAEAILSRQAHRASRLLANIQLAIAPDVIVVGGGIGLAGGYLARLEAALASTPPVRRPRLVAAALGTRAGLVGAADVAKQDAV
jgi:N-acetylmannosamine-6-phosphate 2-epimerase/N-acetylmannosamine kinase